MKIPAMTEAATPMSMATGTAERENYGKISEIVENKHRQDFTRPGKRDIERKREISRVRHEVWN
jgi:hypothetical protein